MLTKAFNLSAYAGEPAMNKQIRTKVGLPKRLISVLLSKIGNFIA
jgi:hypothetical protein